MLNTQSLGGENREEEEEAKIYFAFLKKKEKRKQWEHSRLSKQTAWPCDLTSNKQHQSEVMDHIFICSRHHPVRSSI